MSNSYRKPVIKDKPRSKKRTPEYWRKVRRVQRQQTDKNNLEELEISNPKSIINDYDYCDWIWDFRYMDDEFDEYKEERTKYSRK